MKTQVTTLDDLARVERELRDLSRNATAYAKQAYEADMNLAAQVWGNVCLFGSNAADTIAAYVKAQRERDAANGWQPIETAPRDGSWFLAVSAGVDKRTGRPWQPGIVAINADGDYVPDDFHEDYFTVGANEWPVTHWMPLPAPPKEPTP